MYSLLQPPKIFFEKGLAMPKKIERVLFSLTRYCLIRGKKEKKFGSVPWANRYNLKFCRTFGRTILVTSGVSKKTLTNSHDNSRLFSQEKRRLKKDTSNCCLKSSQTREVSFKVWHNCESYSLFQN